MTKFKVTGKASSEAPIVVAVLAFIIAAVFLVIGFIRTGLGDEYVGGDAYNFIISAGLAAAYFIVSLIFVVIGCSSLIIRAINKPVEYVSNLDLEELNKPAPAVPLVDELPPL